MKSEMKFRAVLLAGTLLAGCAVNPMKNANYDQGFANRALEINQAYYSELNGQILKNIIRARDNQPRFYTSLSELAITPSSKRTDELPGLDLKDAFANFKFGRKYEHTNSINLTVSPKVTKNDTSARPVYHSPISIKTFMTYYNDWHELTVDNLLIDQVKRNVPFNDKVIEKILKDEDGTFYVYAGVKGISSSRNSHCNISKGCQILQAVYCFEEEFCSPNSNSNQKETEFSIANTVEISNGEIVKDTITNNKKLAPNSSSIDELKGQLSSTNIPTTISLWELT